MNNLFVEKIKQWKYIIIVVVILILIVQLVKMASLIEKEVGEELKQILYTMEETSELLESTENEETKAFVLEMAYDTINCSEKSVASLTKKLLFIKDYDLSDMGYYILIIRGENNILETQKKFDALSNYIHDTGIYEILEKENYNYFFDSKGVNEKVKEINTYCLEQLY